MLLRYKVQYEVLFGGRSIMAKITKKKKALSLNTSQIDENSLFTYVSKIIEKRKNRAGMYANREVTLMYWEIGRYIVAP